MQLINHQVVKFGTILTPSTVRADLGIFTLEVNETKSCSSTSSKLGCILVYPGSKSLVGPFSCPFLHFFLTFIGLVVGSDSGSTGGEGSGLVGGTVRGSGGQGTRTGSAFVTSREEASKRRLLLSVEIKDRRSERDGLGDRAPPSSDEKLGDIESWRLSGDNSPGNGKDWNSSSCSRGSGATEGASWQG